MASQSGPQICFFHRQYTSLMHRLKSVHKEAKTEELFEVLLPIIHRARDVFLKLTDPESFKQFLEEGRKFLDIPDINAQLSIYCWTYFDDNMELLSLFNDEEDKAALHADLQGDRVLSSCLQAAINHAVQGRINKNEIPIFEIDIKKPIGEGGFGKVYSGIYKNQPVAVKILINENPTQSDIDLFQKEYDILKGINSEYVVRCIGICTLPGALSITTELMCTSLKSLLYKTQTQDNSMQMRLTWAREIAMGIKDLHKLNIIHRDIKADNILLDSKCHCKITDFGLSVLHKQTTTTYDSRVPIATVQDAMKYVTYGQVGTLSHMAPETFKKDDQSQQVYSDKSDIYAFGILLWELVTHNRPFSDCPNNDLGFMNIKIRVRDNNERLSVANIWETYVTLLESCWHKEPSQRPSADEIIKRIDEVMLLAASGYGDPNKIAQLIESGVNVNARGAKGCTALHIAAYNGNLECMRMLLRYNADVSLVDDFGAPPLYDASYAGNYDELIELLTHGAQVDVTTHEEFTPLVIACKNNHADIACVLVAAGASLEVVGNKCLHFAAKHGQVELVKLLLEDGRGMINVNGIDASSPCQKCTALCYAAQGGHEEVVKLLIQEGAQVFAFQDQCCPLYKACINGHVAVLEELLRHTNNVNSSTKGHTPLHVAASKGSLELVKILLQNGASVNVESNAGFTPLHLAATKGDARVVIELLENGADAHAKAKNGMTPLMTTDNYEIACLLGSANPKEGALLAASHYGYLELLVAFAETGGDINEANETGDTPLFIAARNGDVEMVEKLIELGAKLNLGRKDHTTPIYVASHQGHTEVVNVLMLAGADIEVQTEYGHTPLMAAVFEHHDSIVKLLLENGAAWQSRDKDGKTALHWAAANGTIAAFKTLLKFKADVNTTTNDGVTPILLVARREDSGDFLIELLRNPKLDVNIATIEGVTPLHVAAQFDKVDMCRKLVGQKKANINATTNMFRTPLHVAAIYGNINTVKLLLQLHANPRVAADKIHIPLIFAIEFGDFDIFWELYKCASDTERYNAFCFAVEGGYYTIARALDIVIPRWKILE